MLRITAGTPNSSNVKAKLQPGISQRAMASQLDLIRTQSQEADCGTCLGAASKGHCGCSLSLNREAKERATCLEAARRLFPPARLWAKLITAGEQKKSCHLPQQAALSQCHR